MSGAKYVVAALFATLLLVAAAHGAVRSPRTLRVTVHVARVNSEERIESEFVARSSPGSARFRDFLSSAALESLVRGRPESVSAVTAFLAEIGAANVRVLATKDAVTATITEAAAAKLGYNGHSGRFALPVPASLGAHARYVILSVANKPLARRGVSAGEPGATQTPVTINARYKVPSSVTIPSNYSQGVAEFEGEYFADSDIQTFAAQYNLPNISIPVLGANTPSANADSTEGTLDLEYMASVSGGQITTWWLEGNTNNNDPGSIDFTAWADNVLGLSPMPYVVSISWGMGYENYVNGQDSIMYTDNDAFRKLGLRGISVFAASGDSGPGVRSEEFNCQTFTPSWPASSPYVTSVGATYSTTTTSAEISVDWSGGGFSTIFPRPAYQDAAVSAYLNGPANLPASSFYNATGRGYPDVSALGTNYNVYVGGSWQAVSGTSCASPTFAGVVSLIVAERLSSGRSALGFLNPTLYSLGKVGYDVVSGTSQDTNCLFATIPGFPAATGWDAVSGLGTPDYEYLRAHL